MGYVSASGCFGNWDFVCESLAPVSPNPIQSVRRRIKKLRALMSRDEVDLCATDEVHFQQYGSRCRMWVPPEVADPVLFDHPRRESVGYFGAVRLRDGKFAFRRECERFNGQSFFDFMRQLRNASTRAGRNVVVITDNAKYHHASVVLLS